MGRFRQVAVLKGGVSAEREVSLVSGGAVTEGLRQAGYDARPVDVTAERLPDLPAGTEAVFLALHGGYGEDGRVQADLDRAGVPYTGAGSAASRLAMDKVLTKRALEARGIPVPAYEVLPPGRTHTALPLPVVVKPPRDGSSVGVVRVRQASEWDAALAQARRIDPEVLVERYVPGREWTVGVVGDEALPVIEIAAPDGWYDYRAKYTAGLTHYLFPEDGASAALRERCRVLALEVFRALGARGLGRVDFRVTDAGEPYVLELNTLPGFTPTSLLPKAAARVGLSFPALCARVIESARFDPPRIVAAGGGPTP
jgi:D-alanine-D-alanine ligase